MKWRALVHMLITEEVINHNNICCDMNFIALKLKAYNLPTKTIFKGQTCYKRTEDLVDWDEARRQCWLWGGELAFPLPNQHCTVVSYATQTEEVIGN